MEKKGEKVSIVKCSSYGQSTINEAVINAFNLADIQLPKRKNVLIKPNLVGNFPKNQIAIVTHPSIIEAVCKLLKKNNCKIFIGDSSFMDTESTFEKSGVEKIAKKYGAKIIIFELDQLIRIKDPGAKILKEFRIAKTVKDVDLIINIPKLKTHQLMKYTGAIKNLFGLIPGGEKQEFHKRAYNEKLFASLLVDIYQNIKPEINLIDGVIGMEGKGPTSGTPKKVGYILASKDAVSLDVACSWLMGYNPKKILYIKEAIKRKIGKFEFSLVGMDKLPNLNFKKPHVVYGAGQKMLEILRKKPIVVDKSKCVKCGICARKCPMKAITLAPYPVIDKRKCIRCFCCMEICPQNALSLKE